MLKEKVVTSGDGLYLDSYESGRYVYKGAAPENCITFNGEEAGWRIISVEADGTLKIIKNSSIGNMIWDENGTNTWSSATLNTYLNGTYKSSLTGISNIQKHNFSIGAVYLDNTDLASQISDEESTMWNGEIGLISLSEYIRANTNTSQCGNVYILSSNYSICRKTNWISVVLQSSYPLTINARINTTNNVALASEGPMIFYESTDSTGVVPALYLKSDITLSGSGTSGEPCNSRIKRLLRTVIKKEFLIKMCYIKSVFPKNDFFFTSK